MAHTQQNPGQKSNQANKPQVAKQAAKSQPGSAQKTPTSKPAKKDDQQHRSGKH